MIINGFNYTEEEILEALRRKGYEIVPYRYYTLSHVHGSRFNKEWYDTKCAVKGDELPCEKNIWTNVALKEFQKEIKKPPLV